MLEPNTSAPRRTLESDAATCGESHARLSVPQLVDRIMELNPSASGQFLVNFRREALRDYLDHLVCTSSPRGREARWLRRGDTPGIVVREPRD